MGGNSKENDGSLVSLRLTNCPDSRRRLRGDQTAWPVDVSPWESGVTAHIVIESSGWALSRIDPVVPQRVIPSPGLPEKETPGNLLRCEASLCIRNSVGRDLGQGVKRCGIATRASGIHLGATGRNQFPGLEAVELDREAREKR